MRIDVVTIFPDLIRAVLGFSIVKRAREAGLVDIQVHDLRDWAPGIHRSTDDTPYGGGAGMVMRPGPLFDCVGSLPRVPETRVALLTPQGQTFSQAKARELSCCPHLVLICGHYEGFDERVREHLATEDISVGDYVLTGGELPALTIIDAVTRLQPGALGSAESAEDDTFSDGLLEYPHYTRPPDFRGWRVPDVLLSGHHAEIAKWRRKEQFRRTQSRRPDLWAEFVPSKSDLKLLKQLAEEPSPPHLEEGVEESPVHASLIQEIERAQRKESVPDFGPGDTVRVHVKVVEGGKERVQIFEGTVIFRKKGLSRSAFMVRKISNGYGVERTFLLHSPRVDKIEVTRRGLVRRAKLFYLRKKVGKAARIKEKRSF